MSPPRRVSQEGLDHIRMRLCRADADGTPTLAYDDIASSTQEIDKERNNEVFERQKFIEEKLVKCTFFDYLHETALMTKKHLFKYWNSDRNE